MADHSSSWTKTFTRDTSKDIYEEVSYDTTKPKFDVVTITSDLYLKQQFDDNDMLLFVYVNSDGIRTLGTTYKGSTYETRPAAVGDYKLNYITGENKIFWDAPNYESTENSFPIAIVDRSADVGFTSIDQVFNGFGYIGSTVFALPGVKGLIPNGRNTDGSLKNTEVTVGKVLTYTYSVTLPNAYMSIVGDSGQGGTSLNYRTISGTPTSAWYHNEEKNIYTFNGVVRLWVDYGTISTSSGKITSFTPKTAFHAVDWNDKSEIIGWGAPDYSATLSGVGNNYTAPSDGIFWFSVGNNNGSRSIGIIPHGSSQVVFTNVYNSYGTSGGYQVYLAKGDRIIVTNSDTGLASSYFIPLKGVN